MILIRQQFLSSLHSLIMNEEHEDPDLQGFISCELQINTYHNQLEDKQSTTGQVFEPHYVLGSVMIRKQPKQCYQRVKQIPTKIRNNQNKSQTIPRSNSSKVNVHQIFGSILNYNNIYSRFKDPLANRSKSAFGTSCHNKSIKLLSKHPIINTSNFQEIYVLGNSNDDELIFDSKFEGGNLLSAYRSLKNIDTYVLFMQNDSNTNGYNQWFNFSIKNAQPSKIYTFRIANFRKRYSFFKKGMQPVIFSLLKHRKQGNGWYRDGINVNYYQSQFIQSDCSPYYTLQFQLQFEYSNDYVTISANPPYTYSRLIHFLSGYSQDLQQKNINMVWKTAGRSLGGNNVPYLIISKDDNSLEQTPKSKPKIVIFGRQHSGEIWSSFLLEQFLLKLSNEESIQNQWLLQSYDLHIFPMLNVDGVIYGNFRCDIAGYDLNRCWKDTSYLIHAQLYKIKDILQYLAYQSIIEYCFDLHTHSKELGIFAYCCIESQQCRMAPFLMGEMVEIFRYRACTFGISKDKKETARATLYEITNSINIITIQMSTFGYFNKETKQVQHFDLRHMEEFAQTIIKTVYKSKIKQKSQFMIKTSKMQETTFDCNAEELQDPISGSDSDPEVDEIKLQVKMKKIFPKSFFKELSKKKESSNKKIIKPSTIYKRPFRIKRPKTQVLDTFESTEIKKVKSKYNKVFQNQKRESPSRIMYNQSIHQKSIEPIMTRISELEQKNPSRVKQMYRQASQNKSINLKIKKMEEKKSQKEDLKTKPLNTFEFSLKNLPIFAHEVLPQSYQSLAAQNQSLMMTSLGLPRRQRYSRSGTQKSSKTNNLNSTLISNTVGFKQIITQDKQLPYLCILSQKKRSEHLQTIKQRKLTIKNKFQVRTKKPQLIIQSDNSRYQDPVFKLNNYQRRADFESMPKKIADNLSKYRINLQNPRNK